jgi:multiple sugar transport system ATP-binding protein
MSQVSLIDVSKIYPNGIKAVKKCCIGIERGELLVLVGPSGCGKSTLLRMIAGLESISEGKIFIGDQLVNDVPPKDRNIAMVFQNYALYPHMTVYDNMAFALKLRNFPKSEIQARVKEATDILGLGDFLTRKPKELSGGQRQRVAVGRAIVRKPIAFLFDEPLSNLDAKMRVQMRTEINKLHIRLKTTMIYVTHDQTEAMTLGNRIVVMKDGEIQQVATPAVVYRSPRNKFVAEFIGSPPINTFMGTLQKTGIGYTFVSAELRVAVPEEWEKRLTPYANKPLIFGIRPEDIYDKLFISDKNPRNITKAVCEVVEPMGSETFLYMKCGTVGFIARVSGQVQVEPNTDIDMVFDVNRGHFFDAGTEETIV